MGRSKKVAFTDLRDWIATLEDRGQLARVKPQVDWQYEMGHIIRRTWDVYGDASPAILFESIKDYAPPGRSASPPRRARGASSGRSPRSPSRRPGPW